MAGGRFQNAGREVQLQASILIKKRFPSKTGTAGAQSFEFQVPMEPYYSYYSVFLLCCGRLMSLRSEVSQGVTLVSILLKNHLGPNESRLGMWKSRAL